MLRSLIEGSGRAGGPEGDPLAETRQVQALLKEVWMLVDYIAGLSNQGLTKVELENPATGKNYTPLELLTTLSALDERVDKGQLDPGDRSLVEIVRDALNLLVRPASGLTVAYTTMVSGPLRNRSASRFRLAQLAYPNLAWRAARHRYFQYGLLFFAISVTGLATWESAKVALGKALLQNLDVLQAKQATLNTAKVKLELATAAPDQRRLKLEEIDPARAPPLAAYRVCDRPVVVYARNMGQPLEEVLKQESPGPRMLVYETAEESDLCGQDDILRANLSIAHDDITAYMQNWPAMMGSLFAATRNLAEAYWPFSSGSAFPPLRDAQKDVELRAAPILLVWGNFVLPIIFSTIGSAIFVILDHYNKVRASVLDPRDFFLAPVRLALGLIVGACVGLFFSAYGPVPQTPGSPTASALISSLTLTASGVAFLAGFGVETVFSLLEALINRVFSLPAAQKS